MPFFWVPVKSVEPTVSVIVPTFNETPNLDTLVNQFVQLRETWRGTFGVMFMDDNSPDGTGYVAAELARGSGLEARVVTRFGRRGIGDAIVEGIRKSETELICVMDADLSHPPALIPRLVEALDGADGVVASRYVDGSRIVHWPIARRTISLIATCLARILLNPRCRDPLSGFFLFRRTSLLDAEVTGLAGKPLLEILVRKPLVVREVPYAFRNRQNGESKFTLQTISDFVRLITRLRNTGDGRDGRHGSSAPPRRRP